MRNYTHPNLLELLPGFNLVDNGVSTCPNAMECGQQPGEFEIRNYSLMWHDGEVCCTRCGTKIRDWDAG